MADNRATGKKVTNSSIPMIEKVIFYHPYLKQEEIGNITF